jgi:hypothetical protein
MAASAAPVQLAPLAAPPPPLSRSWQVVRRSGAAYTGGAVAVAADGGAALCLCAERVAVLDLSSGAVVRLIPSETPVRAAALSSLL